MRTFNRHSLSLSLSYSGTRPSSRERQRADEGGKSVSEGEGERQWRERTFGWSEWMPRASSADLSECRWRKSSSIPRLSNSVYGRWEYPACVLVRQEAPEDSDEVVRRRCEHRPSAYFPALYPGQREAWDQKKCPLQSAESSSTLGSSPTWVLFWIWVTQRDTQIEAVSKSYLRTWKSRPAINHSIPQTSWHATHFMYLFLLRKGLSVGQK